MKDKTLEENKSQAVFTWRQKKADFKSINTEFVETPKEIASMFCEKYLQGKSYDYVTTTARHIVTLAEINCKLPTLTEEN